jgi:hypothetical protein
VRVGSVAARGGRQHTSAALGGNFRWIASLVLAGLVTGCFDPSSYKPGGSEFPKSNPSPSHTFVLLGSIDPALSIEFDAIYGVTNTNCMHHSASSYIEGAGVVPPDAAFPVSIRREGDRYSGHVAIDGVYPGRCGWRFRGVIARAAGEDEFRGGIMATGGWVGVPGEPYSGQPSANPPAKTWKCSIPTQAEAAMPGPPYLAAGRLLCSQIPRDSPDMRVSLLTTSVELNLIKGDPMRP